MEFGIVGTSVWQQNFPLIERLTIDREERASFLRHLKQELGLSELVYLATCNRVEFIYIHSGQAPKANVLHRIIDHFFRGNRDLSFFPNDFYHFTDREAITHLFRTVSSLESLVVGETQITGQFKDALEYALAEELAGLQLERLGREALNVARTVKRETSIGSGCLSMASLAASEAKKALEDRSQPLVALVGSGPMTRKLASHLRDLSEPTFLFVNRTESKAQSLAAEFGGEAMSLEAFQASPPGLDAIVSATAASEPVFESSVLDRLPTTEKPVVCIDLAVPRDFAPEFSTHDSICLIDIPVLKSRGQKNLRQKFIEASKANEIVREAVNKYLANRIEGSLKPIFQSSYQQSLEIADQALDTLFEKRIPSLTEKEREAVVRLVKKLIGQTTFQPARMLSDRLVELRHQINLTELSELDKEAG